MAARSTASRGAAAAPSLGTTAAILPDSLLDPLDDAQDGLSTASHQLRALAALSGSLTDPLTPEEAAEIVERHALAALGATSAVIVTLGNFPPNGPGDASVPLVPVQVALAPQAGAGRDPVSDPVETLTLVHAIGVRDIAYMPTPLRLDSPVPLAEVARTGKPVFLNGEAELRRYPAWSEGVLKAGASAAAAVPVWANGHLRGVLGLTWNTPRVFDKDERAFVLTLGVMCAQAIMRGHLVAAERRAREIAEHAIQSQGQFLRTMTHELRSPLSAVVGYTQLLSDEIVGPVTPVQKAHLRRARRASEHVLTLIEELLRFARLEAGEERIQVEHVIAADIVDEALDIVRPIAELKGVSIRVEAPDEAIALDTDRLKLRQILVNLVTNAVKYTDVGNVMLIVRVEGLGTALKIHFEVTDTGRGIAAGDHGHIFEAFWQAPHPLRRQSDGTGLGLPVARQLARLLGGDVVIAHSEVGRGSTFIASLPAHYPVTTPMSERRRGKRKTKFRSTRG
jgi:signal transduction histidine kinase